jgi:hypothetical protein
MSSTNLNDPHAPYLVYKPDISYFSGKLEAYLRYKKIPYSDILKWTIFSLQSTRSTSSMLFCNFRGSRNFIESNCR